MRIKKNPNGTYSAHIKTEHGNQAINLKTKNAKEAAALARDAKLEELERAALVKALTAETVVRITSGGKVTCDDALTEWLTWASTVGLTPNTVERYRTYISAFLDEFRLHGKPPSAVKPEQVDKFVNPAESKIKSATRANRLSALQSFFMVCAAKGLSIQDPTKLVKIKSHLMTFEQKETKVMVPFNKADLSKLRKLEDPFWRVAALLGENYGLRISDVAQLEWASFSKRGKIVVWTDKHDRRVEMDLVSEVERAVAELPKLDSRYVFPEHAETSRNPKLRAKLSVYFARILAREGIEGMSFHNLRHTFATSRAKYGDSIDEIRLKLGHALKDTTEGYVHA